MNIPNPISAALIALLALALIACGDTPPPINDDVPSPGTYPSSATTIADSVCMCVQQVMMYTVISNTGVDDASMQEIDIVAENVRALGCVEQLETRFGNLRNASVRRQDISEAIMAQCANAIDVLEEL